ncbi:MULTISPECIES: hypothetical protein [unclassified Sphingomonas]|jgi:hypothetical protein|uniref:hypothetical protein n=1 Tax=unclassified Sphingomonas TaxID=196159 RepID=UPI00082CC5A5|nr:MULTISPECIES: hypothetical protein [unclassified Sphingomonas]
MTDLDQDQPAPLPEGEYAIVEVLGHRTLVGRVTEVDRFGAKLMSIEPIYQGKLLDAVLIGGSSIYQFTPCTAESARKVAPQNAVYLPTSIRATLPAPALPAPDDEDDAPFGDLDDDEDHFSGYAETVPDDVAAQVQMMIDDREAL